MTEGLGKGVWDMRDLQAGTVTEETEAVAVTGTEIMTAEGATIATITGKEIENQGDLVVMTQGVIQGAIVGHVPRGTVLGIMIDMDAMAIEITTSSQERLVPFLNLKV